MATGPRSAAIAEARANTRSPVITATWLPQTSWADGAPRRTGAESITSSWYSVARCVSSTTTAASSTCRWSPSPGRPSARQRPAAAAPPAPAGSSADQRARGPPWAGRWASRQESRRIPEQLQHRRGQHAEQHGSGHGEPDRDEREASTLHHRRRLTGCADRTGEEHQHDQADVEEHRGRRRKDTDDGEPGQAALDGGREHGKLPDEAGRERDAREREQEQGERPGERGVARWSRRPPTCPSGPASD